MVQHRHQTALAIPDVDAVARKAGGGHDPAEFAWPIAGSAQRSGVVARSIILIAEFNIRTARNAVNDSEVATIGNGDDTERRERELARTRPGLEPHDRVQHDPLSGMIACVPARSRQARSERQ
jgi:hypothetical protein